MFIKLLIWNKTIVFSNLVVSSHFFIDKSIIADGINELKNLAVLEGRDEIFLIFGPLVVDEILGQECLWAC